MLGGDEHCVVRPCTRDRYIGDVKRLAIDIAIHRVTEQLAEGG